ncbi:MAG: response regulator [Deltaproteobacteria bacterium]|nr:response regulator [Deltaproteobacteria bacterium]MCB9478543.1 response regulator [Deltaproteobacteria bacterium]MCB9488376.1 response regulator [Deltaproteobacteria bacterium]
MFTDEPKPEPEKRPAPATIMVVEDDPNTRKMLEVFLTKEGFDVKTAVHGIQLVRVLKVHQPDLILLDIVLNWLDGYELCRMIRAHEEWSKIPVVFITGLPEDQVRERAFQVGGTEVYFKPLDIPELIRGVRRILHLPEPEKS